MSKPERETAIQHGTQNFNFSIHHHYTGGGPFLFFNNHWHPEYEIIYVKYGSPIFEIEGKSYHLAENQALIVDRYQLHAWTGVNSSSFYFSSIVFGNFFLFPDSHSQIYTKYIHPHQKEIRLQTVILGTTPWEKEVLHILKNVCQVATEQKYGFELNLQILLLRVFSEMISAGAYEFISDIHDSKRIRIRDILFYIHSNYQQDIQIAHLAEELHISTEHFIRSFREVTGKSPKKYLLDYRLHCAVSKLTESDDKISMIAESCGFTDMSYFTKRFKEYTGKTPKEFQNAYRMK